jgi:hypothetical protein
MKRLINKTLGLLLVINVVCIILSPITFAQDEVFVFQKTYNKDGRFHMPVLYNGNQGSEATMSATLTDENNNLIITYPSKQVTMGTTITYSNSFAPYKSGTYYLNVRCDFLFKDPITKKLKITYNAPGPTMVYTNTYQTYTDAGYVKQVFKLDYSNALGKKLSIEIYDEYGQFIYSNFITTNYATGNCTFRWDYFPSNGGIMVSNGTYILKYWVEGQSPRQQKFQVKLGEG